MAFENIKTAQKDVVQLLENSFKKGRLSHAYLFEGDKGAKQFETALYFAQMLLCTNDADKPCLACHNCKRVMHYTHPNVYIVEPIKNTIRKHQIADLQTEFSKTAIEAGYKIYIIKDIDQIQVSAANALLKFLEEPHKDIIGILTTTNRSAILPTILSRSQIVSFATLSSGAIEQELMVNGYPKKISRILSHLSGSVSEAEALLADEGFEEVIDVIPELYDSMVQSDQSALLTFNERADFILFDKKLSKLFMACMLLFQKDIIHYLDGDMMHLVFEESLDTISSLARVKTKKRRIDELERMLALESRLDRYINERLAYDNLMYELERSE
jgi:DNA polymerase-3 subunit delta'